MFVESRRQIGHPIRIHWLLALPQIVARSPIMKSLLTVACALVIGGLVVLLMAMPPGERGNPTNQSLPAPAGSHQDDRPETDVLQISDVEARRVQVDAAETEPASAPGSWRIRGRIKCFDNVPVNLSKLRVRLSLHDSREEPGDPWFTSVVISGKEGSFGVDLTSPAREMFLHVEVLDVGQVAVEGDEAWVTVPSDGLGDAISVLLLVRPAVAEGTVIDRATREPIEGARLVCRSNEVHTGLNGAFRMELPAVDGLSVTASHPGFRDSTRVLSGLSPGEGSRCNFELERQTGADRIFGVVTDVDGTPCVGAIVECLCAANSGVQTDETGSYALEEVETEPGTVVPVSVHVAERAVETRMFLPARLQEAGEDGLRADFQMRAGATLRGIVRAPHGRGVEGAVVWLGPGPMFRDNETTVTDNGGLFEIRHLAHGLTRVGVEASRGLGAVSQEVTVVADGFSTVELNMYRVSPLEGVVVDKNGQGLGKAISRVTPKGGSVEAASGVSKADGRFHVPGVWRGAIELLVSGDGLASVRIQHDHDGDQVRIEVPRAIRLAGQVIDDSTGRPVESFTVRLRGADNGKKPWFEGVDASWVLNGKTFGSLDGRWITEVGDGINPDAWTCIEFSADGYSDLVIGSIRASELAQGLRSVQRMVRQ